MNKTHKNAICRVCIRGGKQLVPFTQFDTDRKSYKLAEAISAVGGVQVENDDGLPQHCCVRCMREVESAYKLQRICQESDRKLRQIFRVKLDLASQVEVKQPMPPEYIVEMLPEEDSVKVKEEPVEDEGEATELQQMEYSVEGLEPNEGSSAPELNLVKEEIHIDDQEDEFIDEDSNSMEREETVYDVTEQDDFYEKLSAEDKLCCGCKQRFETKDELLAHRDTVHIDKKLTKKLLDDSVQCNICFKVFKNLGFLSAHRKRGSFEYRCKTCGETFINRIRVTHHFHIKHAQIVGGASICCGCEQCFNSQEELAAHSKAVHLPKRPPPDSNRSFECDICYACYKNEHGLYIHKTKFTKKAQKFQCKECGKFFRYYHGLKEHKQTHDRPVRTRCHLCPFTESSHKELLKHIAAHKTPDNRYKCLECGLTYSFAQGLRNHGLTHTGERPHSCPHCPSTFTKAAQLTRHIKIHLNQRDYECKFCSKTFVDPSNLNQHVKYHHLKLRPVLCFFCDQSFATRNDRRRHLQTYHPAELQANPELEAEIRVKKKKVANKDCIGIKSSKTM